MRYDLEYVRELENTIMDDLLPMYLAGCRSCGVDPRMNQVLKRLMEARGLRQEMPYLLRSKHND